MASCRGSTPLDRTRWRPSNPSYPIIGRDLAGTRPFCGDSCGGQIDGMSVHLGFIRPVDLRPGDVEGRLGKFVPIESKPIRSLTKPCLRGQMAAIGHARSKPRRDAFGVPAGPFDRVTCCRSREGHAAMPGSSGRDAIRPPILGRFGGTFMVIVRRVRCRSIGGRGEDPSSGLGQIHSRRPSHPCDGRILATEGPAFKDQRGPNASE